MVTGRILVADEEIFIRRTLRHMLTKKGYRVSCVANGREAWECIAAGYDPDILIMGEIMTEMPWFDLCKAIKVNPEHAPIHIVWLTDRWLQKDREKAASAGIDELMTKPFSPSAIARRVKEIIEEKHVISNRQSQGRRQSDSRLANASQGR